MKNSFLRGYNISSYWKLRQQSHHLGAPCTTEPRDKEGLTLSLVIDCDYEGEVGLLLHKRGEVDCVWSLGDSLVYIPYSLIEVIGSLQQPNMGSLRNEIWVILADK